MKADNTSINVLQKEIYVCLKLGKLKQMYESMCTICGHAVLN